MTNHRRYLVLGLALLPLAWLAADTAAALALGWRPRGTIEAGLLFFVAAATAASLLVLVFPATRRVLLRRAPELLLLAVGTVAAAAVLEVGARVVEVRLQSAAGPFHTRGPGLHQVFQPDPQFVHGIAGPSAYTTQASGLRAPVPPPPGALPVIFVGGSTTECTYLDDEGTWAYAAVEDAAARAGVDAWAGIAAVSGFDTRAHVRFIENAPIADTAALFVVQTGVNDLWRFLAGEEGEIVYERFSTAPAAPRNDKPPPPYRPQWARARTIQLWHTLRQPPPDPALVEGENGAEYAIRRARRAEAEKTAVLPQLELGVARYRLALEDLVLAARARGVPLVLVSQPVLWAEDLPEDLAARCWFGWLPDGRYLTLGALRTAMDAYNNAMRHVAAEAEVPFVNLGELQGDGAYFYDDCHFTEAGAAAVAERVAARLAPLLARKAQPRP